MQNETLLIKEKDSKYSKMLSSLFCSSSIIALSMLCLLNNMSIDLYSATILLKVVLPASFCFWFIGLVIGKILDNHSEEIVATQQEEEKKAYEIPSIFSDTSTSAFETEENAGDLWTKST